LFHSLVLGGKWQTAMRKPVSSASFCSSISITAAVSRYYLRNPP
jgi:hypothetical protein